MKTTWRHARRLFLWCCVFYTMLIAVWVIDDSAADEPARIVAGRVAVVAVVLGPAFYLAWQTLFHRRKD